MTGGLERFRAGRRLRRRDDGRDQLRRPYPDKPEGSDCIPEIHHIVLLMMENHSFDNYFGTLGHGSGFTTGPDGNLQPFNDRADGSHVFPYHFTSTLQNHGVPTQSWNASHIQFADGTNEGFVRSIEQTVPGGDPRVPMGYWTEDDLPFYSDLARSFALADRWHCSLLGPTFPNRRFLIAATANGLIDDVMAGMIDYPQTGTIFDLLDRNGISWVNYHHVTDASILFRRLLGSTGMRIGRLLRLCAASPVPKTLSVGLDNLQFTADLYPLGVWRCRRHLRHIDRFFEDAANGDLPAISVVDPDFQGCSEENPEDVRIGEGFAASVINAVMEGKGWPNTLLIWFYDEHGGYFDHVSPPAAPEPDLIRPRSLLDSRGIIRWILQRLGDWTKLAAADSGSGRYDRLGFRVPAVVVSPFSKPGYVSSTIYDHTSALKLIEQKWNLPPLTERDAAAVAPLDMIDLGNPALLTPPKLADPTVPWGTTLH